MTNTKTFSNIALIFAGGTGARMQGAKLPKQFLELGNKPIIAHTINHFQNHPLIDAICVVCVKDWIDYFEHIVKENKFDKVFTTVPGGETGQQSIYNGLRAIENDARFNSDTVVLVHDGVRPLINEKVITKCIESVRTRGCTATTAPSVETVIEEKCGRVNQVLDRSVCKLARAPQSFFFTELLNAHKKAIKEGLDDFIDSVSLMSHYKHTIFTVEGPVENIKITTPADFFVFKGYSDMKEYEQLWNN